MIKFRILMLIITIIIFPPQVNAGSSSCKNRVQKLNKQREEIMSKGGTWSLFEKFPQLRSRSGKGLFLDQEINRMVNLSNYICETIDGAPLNDLAVYVVESVKKMGEDRFREQLKLFGKPDKDVEDWFNYTKSALQFQKRTFKSDKVEFALEESSRLLRFYGKLVLNQSRPSVLLENTKRLTGQIREFIENDPNISQALFEIAQEPYWDIDENYGGS